MRAKVKARRHQMKGKEAGILEVRRQLLLSMTSNAAIPEDHKDVESGLEWLTR